MKKIILGICDNNSKRGIENVENRLPNVIKLIVIDTETEWEDQELPVITLKPNAYNRLSWDVLSDLLSPDNQKYLLIAGEEDKLSEKDITQNNLNFVRTGITPPRFSLTQQQRVIMDLAVEGLPAQEIADKLCRSYHTIKNHLSNIYEKMRVRSLPEAIDKYLEYRKRMN